MFKAFGFGRVRELRYEFDVKSLGLWGLSPKPSALNTLRGSCFGVWGLQVILDLARRCQVVVLRGLSFIALNPKFKETTGGEFRVYRASIRLP